MKCAQSCTKLPVCFCVTCGDAAGALAHLQRATQLDCQAGVKKEIERLERELKPKPEPQPKAATRAPRKTRSVAPQKRGRPKKKAS
ncbi:small terminase subunit [Escherichia coli]|nr:small terminase subunit [Escherichia coli]